GRLLAACRDGTLNEVLKEGTFVERVTKTWKELPVHVRNKISGGTQSAGKKAVVEKITPPSELLGDLPRWTKEPHSFLCDKDPLKASFGQEPLKETYEYMFCLDSRSQTDRIRTRFIKLVFYRLKKELNISNLTKEHRDRLANMINKSGVLGDNEEIGNKVAKWIPHGKKYDNLCNELALRLKSGTPATAFEENKRLGFLFCLNEESDNFWEVDLPMEGDKWNAVIDRLVESDIHACVAENSLDAIADGVFGYMWEKIKCFLSDEFNALLPRLNVTPLNAKCSSGYSRIRFLDVQDRQRKCRVKAKANQKARAYSRRGPSRKDISLNQLCFSRNVKHPSFQTGLATMLQPGLNQAGWLSNSLEHRPAEFHADEQPTTGDINPRYGMPAYPGNLTGITQCGGGPEDFPASAQTLVDQDILSPELSYHTFTSLRDTDDAFRTAAYQSYLSNGVQYGANTSNMIGVGDMPNVAYQVPLNDGLPNETYVASPADMVHTVGSELGTTQGTVRQSHTNGGFLHPGRTLRDTDDAMQNTAYQSYLEHGHTYASPASNIVNTVE
ncbi:hypothetical protein KXV77_008057, partial [Aspergillus fumigatus]